MTTLIANLENAAIKATETLIKHHIVSTPIDPMPILKTLPGVIVLSYAEMADHMGVERSHVVKMFGRENQDAATTVSEVNGKLRYIVAYNQKLPFYMLQRALARELGHIVLGHDGSRPDEVRTEESLCFARYLLCPRPLIKALSDAGVTITSELIGNITGCYERCLAGIKQTIGAHVPAELNRLVRDQFADYLENFLSFQEFVFDPNSPIADFGSYMDNYEE